MPAKSHISVKIALSRQNSVDDLTFLRWAGSKKKLLHELFNRSPRQYRSYIEPFVGSARLFFRLRPRSGTISDINPSLTASETRKLWVTVRATLKRVV